MIICEVFVAWDEENVVEEKIISVRTSRGNERGGAICKVQVRFVFVSLWMNQSVGSGHIYIVSEGAQQNYR